MGELMVGQIISLPAQAVDQLIQQGNGDAALLCLALLRYGEVEQARQRLHWNQGQVQLAWDTLADLGLVQSAVPPAPAPTVLEPEGPPDYSRSDLLQAMGGASVFAQLVKSVDMRLQKKLSEADVKALYEIYDYLALPVDVILPLITWCIQRQEEKQGPNHYPRMSQIKKTAYQWHRMGIDTAEAAENYLRVQGGLLQRERELLPRLGISARGLIDREREYLSTWVDMGFPDEAICLAYERTILKKQSLNWAYMNSILKSWHSKGLHTLAEIQVGDTPARRRPAYETGAAAAAKATLASVENAGAQLQRDAAWLQEFTRTREGG